MLYDKLKSHSLFAFIEKIQFQKCKELFIFCLLLSICNVYTYNQLVKNQESFSFYQTHFAPAVMYACGYDLANPVNKTQINDFLIKKNNTVHCQDIDNKQLSPLTAFQGVEKYLILSAGIIWKIFGLEWKNIIPLFLILYSISVAATYCLFRLAMRRSISFVLTLIVSLSSSQMYYLLQLRDYSVAPFLLWTIWISAKLVIDCPSIQKRLFWCAIAGSLVGIGLGFRTDIIVLMPFFILMFLFFVKKKRSVIGSKVAPLCIFFLCFLIPGYPIFEITSKIGDNLAHVIILGLGSDFTQNLSLIAPKIYSIIPAYKDLISYSVINSFAERMFDIKNLLLSPGKQYDHYGNLFLLNYLYYFPADSLIRTYASIYKVLIYPFQVHAQFLSFLLNRIGLLIPFFSLILIAFYQLRLALFILFSVVYLCSYPVLQFDLRHYFYLDFIGFWFLGFLIEYILSFFNKKDKVLYIQDVKFIIKSRWKGVLYCVAICIILSYGLLLASRTYQTSALVKLFHGYTTLPTKAITAKQDDNENSFSISLPTKIQQTSNISLETFYLKVITKNCSADQIILNLHYLEEPDLIWQPPHEIKIPGGKQGIYFFPIYNFHNPGPTVINVVTLPSHWIDKITFSLSTHSCIENISTVDIKHNAPFLMYLNLYPGWEKNKLYQIFN